MRKIETISVRPVNVPLARPIRTAVGHLPAAALVLIDIRSSDGILGSAYLFAYKASMLKPLVATVEAVASEIIGHGADPFPVSQRLELSFRLLGRQGLVALAMSGIDMALWDIAALAQELPLARLLGGVTLPIQAYDSFGIIDIEADRAEIERSIRRGFRGIKIKIGGGAVEDDVARVRAVREIIGSSVALMVDYNQSLDPAEACRRIEQIRAFDLTWVEEPVPAEDLVGHHHVRATTGMRIQTGENWTFPEQMEKAIRAGASDYAMPDVQKIGGVTGWIKAAALAEAAQLPVSSHVFAEASAHLLAVTPTAHWLEWMDKAGPLLQEPLTVAQDGTVTARGPGLGIAWDEKAVARFAA
ncbi:enolase C-terminal domain-like protein [Dongia sp.]|uniref:enolase C-terminal domain-like protein n=1 Tax=Dongia sp. TaxID=1977262 RepID=UPI003751A57E